MEGYGSHVKVTDDWSKYTSLFNTNLDRKEVRLGTVVDNSGHHPIVEVFQDGKEIWWAAKFCQDFPQEAAVNGIKSFGKVYEGEVEGAVLLTAFLLEEAGNKRHVNC